MTMKYLMEMYEALLVDASSEPDVWKVKQECWRLLNKASKWTRQEAEEEVQKAMAQRQIKKAEDVPELRTIDPDNRHVLGNRHLHYDRRRLVSFGCQR